MVKIYKIRLVVMFKSLFFCCLQASSEVIPFHDLSKEENKQKIDFLQNKEDLQVQLEEHRKSQQKIVTDELQRKKDRNERDICTFDEVVAQVIQKVSSQEYKKIPLNTFCDQYAGLVMSAIQEKSNFYELYGDQHREFYRLLRNRFLKHKMTIHNFDELKNKSFYLDSDDYGKSVIYKLLGKVTLDQNQQIPTEKSNQDNLYQLEPLLEDTEAFIKKYIDTHYQDVERTCGIKKFFGALSTEVLATPCCREQYHKSCLEQARASGVQSCSNFACRKQEQDGIYRQTPWDDQFFNQLLCQERLSRNAIQDKDCLFCAEPLFKKLSTTALLSKRTNFENNIRNAFAHKKNKNS